MVPYRDPISLLKTACLGSISTELTNLDSSVETTGLLQLVRHHLNSVHCKFKVEHGHLYEKGTNLLLPPASTQKLSVQNNGLPAKVERMLNALI